MLSLFQNEWDALMLETHSLKQQLEQTRQELSHTLYQHDAACRVIARLVKERDSLNEEFARLQSTRATVSATANGAHPMEVDGESGGPKAAPPAVESTALPHEVVDRLVETNQKLSQTRRKRKLSDALATVDQIRAYNMKSNFSGLHSASQPGLLTMDLHPDQRRVLTGGADKNAQIFDLTEEKVLHTLKGHTKKITDVLFHPTEDICFTGSLDKTVRVWSPNEKDAYKTVETLKDHKGEIVGLSLHPCGDYLASASAESWTLSDFRSGRALLSIPSESSNAGYSSLQFHPDGLILGTGAADSKVRIWDVKSQANVATFEGHSGRVVALAFSENGYYLATAAEDATVKLWDLRKLNNIKTISTESGQPISAVQFDYSGQYLAVAGSDIRFAPFVTACCSYINVLFS